MTIRIVRNTSGNCVNFVGTDRPAYWNACLTAEVNENDSTKINIVNDFRSQDPANVKYEFFGVGFEEFEDRDGNTFTDAATCAEYINQSSKVIGADEVGTDMTGVTVDFRLDQTSTSIIMSTGDAYGVNTIKAVAHTDGTIHLNAIGQGLPTGTEDPHDLVLVEKLEVGNVTVNGTVVAGGLNDIVNTLNELFTVGAFEAVVISDPFSTMVADVGGAIAGYTLEGNDATDPISSDIFTNDSSGNFAGLKSVATIDQAGEYFTFDIRGEGQIGFGLIHTQASFDAGHYIGNAGYANPVSFAGVNSAHYGFQFSHWFHPTPNGSWTNYGASTGFVTGPGWSNWDKKQDWLDGNPVKMRVGIDENGFIAISSKSDTAGEWILHARSSYPVPQGSEFHLGVKVSNNASRVATEPYVHLLEPDAPVLNFRYIESPDGVFNYPVFATQEEAEYYDQNHDGVTGAGTAHTHVYADDPTSTTWYMPDTGSTMSGTTPPQDALYTVFMGAAVSYTEVTTLTDADLAPSAFTANTVSVDELSAVNIQIHPAGASWSTSITDPSGNFSLDSISTVTGTAPEVTSDNVTNPYDDYPITVTRTNSYGSSTGTLTIRVNNLTAPVITAVAGVVHEATSSSLVDSDTLDDGSVVKIDDILDDGNRLVMDKAFIDTYVLPAISSGTGNQSVFIGFGSGSANWSNGVTASDFELAFEFFSNDVERANNRWRLKTYNQGTQVDDVGVGSNTSGLYNYIFVNDGGTVKIGGLLPTYGDASSFVWDGTAMSWDTEVTGLSTQNRDIFIGTNGTQLDLPNPFANFTEVVEPVPAPTILTSWTKALDFSGSSERAQQVASGNSYTPLNMGGVSSTVSAGVSPSTTSNDGSSRPWATAVVFNLDLNASNQHIWNLGEGSGSSDDNIYLRVDAQRQLYFGWGRTGALNELRLTADIGTAHWYGVYIASNGTRLSGGQATASNLADCFDIRFGGSHNSWTMSGNLSTATNWSNNATSTGGRMDRSFAGEFTIGGRGANRSFHGKVASMVVTTLVRNVSMPDATEIEMMVTDPVRWMNENRDGDLARYPQGNNNFTTSLTSGSYFNSLTSRATQVWLMGDGSNDNYSNMIRNRVMPSDQNYTKLNLISMVSNDIQNVNIPGLS